MASDWFCSVAALCFSFPVGGGGASYAGHQDEGGLTVTDTAVHERIASPLTTRRRKETHRVCVSLAFAPSVRPSVCRQTDRANKTRPPGGKEEEEVDCLRKR